MQAGPIIYYLAMGPLFAIFCVGLAATVGQVLIIRELMALFGGSELASATVFAAWLSWTALGAFLGGRAGTGKAKPARVFVLASTLLAAAIPASIILARGARMIWSIPAGESVGPLGIALLSFAILAPPCLPNGAAFSLAVRLAREKGHRGPGPIFAVEALGAGLGGLLLYFVLLPRVFALLSALIAGLFALAGPVPLMIGRPGKNAKLLAACGAGLLGVLMLLSPGLEKATKGWQWPGHRLIAAKDTVYGSLALVSRGEQISLYDSGVWNFSHPDVASREDAVHYGLLEHPAPKKILLVGSGVSGTLLEVLKHPGVSKVDYVELDPGLIRFALDNLPEEFTRPLNSPRVEVHNIDARLFVRNAAPGSYDVALLNLPDPVNLQLNRYYTKEFFESLKEVIAAGGIVSFSARSSENVIGPRMAEYLASLKATLAAVFPEVVVFPGPRARFFASSSRGVLTKDPEVLVKRLRERRVETKFVAAHYLFANLSRWQLSQMEESLATVAAPLVNTDLSPRCYYHDIVLFSLQHNASLARLFETLAQRWAAVSLWLWVFGGVALAGVALLVFVRRASGPPLYLGMAAAGYAGIAVELVALLGFQAAYGNLYAFIAIIVAGYMAGLALGGWAGSWRAQKLKMPALHLLPIHLGLGLLALPLAALFSAHDLARWIYVLPALLAGFLGGAYFPVASKALGDVKAGPLYAADLAGAALGSLLVGLVFIPLAGIQGACWGVFLLNLWAAAGLSFLVIRQMTG